MEEPFPPTVRLVDKLPPEYLQGIGEVITTWALLEAQLKSITYTILGLSGNDGRTAIRAPRSKEIAEMIAELLHLRGLSIKSVRMADLMENLDLMETERNKVAHQLWWEFHDGAESYYVLQNMQGSWPKKDGVRVKKRVAPESIKIAPDDLAHMASNIRELIEVVVQVHEEVEQLLQSSPGTPA